MVVRLAWLRGSGGVVAVASGGGYLAMDREVERGGKGVLPLVALVEASITKEWHGKVHSGDDRA